MSTSEVRTLKPHISLNVRSVDASVDFYTKLFGVTPMKHIKGNTTTHSIVRDQLGDESEKPRFGYAKFDVENPPLNFVLNEVSYSEGGTLSHLGIQVESTDDVLKTRERWIAEGLLTVDEMKVDCCYALQDKTEPTGEACACGDKVKHQELSTAVCCTPQQKASTIAQSNAPCC
jgi:catechol 2,3-dioxygenase-like lactoylglutathione lyase family enzyme